MGKAKHPHDKTRPESKAVLDAIERDDMDALKLALSPRQRRFCQEYIVDFNGSAAVVRAGYSPNYPDRQASQLKRNAGVSKYIDHLSMSKEAQIMSVSPEYVIQRVTEIVTKESAKDGDKLRGLELLARHLGMFIDRTEITGRDGEAIAIEQRRVEEDAQSFLHLLKGMQNKGAVRKEVVN